MDLFRAVIVLQRGLDVVKSQATVPFQLNKQLRVSPILALPKILAVLKPMTKCALSSEGELVLCLIFSNAKFAHSMLSKIPLLQIRGVAVSL
jgi:hypothetical protein